MLTLRLLGDIMVMHDGESVPLPPSRKTRALLAYLAMASRPVRRESLCAMFWALPDDPKGALRWSLSRLRPVLAADGVERVVADRRAVSIDRRGLSIDALELKAAGASSFEGTPVERLAALAETCCGGFLDDIDLTDAYEFRAWRIAEREELRAIEMRLRRRLASTLSGSPEAVEHARRLVALAPEEEASHIMLVEALEAAGRQREAAAQREIAVEEMRRAGAAPSLRLLRGRATAEPQPPEGGQPATFGAAGPPGPAAARARVNVPHLVVTPFRNLAADPAEDWFVEAMTDEVTRALARMPWFLVVKAHQASGVAADYVLSGAMIRAGGRLRINFRLIEAETGRHVTADRIETGMEGVLEAQDEIAGRIAALMEPTIRLAEIEALRRVRRVDIDAYEAYLRGWSAAFGQSGMDIPAAIGHFERALSLDPENAPAALMLAWLGMQRPENLNREGMVRCAGLARQALRYASGDGAIIAHAAYVLLFTERDYDLALDLARRAGELSPYSPQAWFSRGWVQLCAGDAAEALACFDRSLALVPSHPFAYIAHTGRANALFQLGAHAEAASAARAAVAENPTFHPAWRILAATLAVTGDVAGAAEAVRRMCALAPHECVAFTRMWLPYRDPARLAALCDALTLAGLDEEAAATAGG